MNPGIDKKKYQLTIMNEQPLNENIEIEEPDINPVEDAVQPSAASGWKKWLNYQSVVKQVPFFLFLTLLAVVYIYNGHLADKTSRQINRTAREVRELQHEFKTVKGEVMFRSKQSELAKVLEAEGLKELTESPIVLSPVPDEKQVRTGNQSTQ